MWRETPAGTAPPTRCTNTGFPAFVTRTSTLTGGRPRTNPTEIYVVSFMRCRTPTREIDARRRLRSSRLDAHSTFTAATENWNGELGVGFGTAVECEVGEAMGVG